MRYYTVDVFTDRMFGGNQLAVFPNAAGIPSDVMPRIAREFNYSETTFVLPPTNPAHAARVRIFTPGAELPFAGHPTVGTAHVLALTGGIRLTGDETRVVLEEGVGPVSVTIRSSKGTPMFAELSVAKLPETGVRVKPAQGFSLEVPLTRDYKAGDTLDLKVSLASFVCNEGSNFCTIKSYVWTVPVAFADAGSGTINLGPQAP